VNPTTRLPLDANAYALMVGCCLLWGLKQAAVLVAAGSALVNAPRPKA